MFFNIFLTKKSAKIKIFRQNLISLLNNLPVNLPLIQTVIKKLKIYHIIKVLLVFLIIKYEIDEYLINVTKKLQNKIGEFKNLVLFLHHNKNDKKVFS